MHMMMVEGEIITAGMDGYVRSWNYEQVDMLEAGEESGLVEIEPMNEVLIDVRTHLYYLTQPPKKALPVEEDSMENIPSERDETEDAARHTWFCQDGAGGIWQADLSFRLAAMTPKRLLTFHSGAIMACAVSPVTHLAMTLGEDGTLRLYDFLQKKLLAVKQFQAKGSSLAWIPLCIDHKCATVMAGFSDGGIRRVGIDSSSSTSFGKDRSDCQLRLLQALRPHLATVTDLAYSFEGTQTHSAGGGPLTVGRLSSLCTCSEDKTLFLFNVLSEDEYVPHCFIPLDHMPRHVLWSPDYSTSDHFMVTCDDAIVLEIVQPRVVNHTETLEYHNAQMRAMRFVSVKSTILHEEEEERERKEEEKKEKEREEQNKLLLVKGLETPSQQQIRIDAEDTTAAAERKAKEESEEPWTPYIPPVPSPILQTVYTEGDSKFWLMLGDYDAGYFYECQFSKRLRVGDKDDPHVPEETAPVHAVPMAGDAGDVITSTCFNSDGSCVIMGMKNGRIRLQLLGVEFDLSSQLDHWSSGAHDGTHGAVRGVKLSHDEAFLITVGQDGNLFVFTLVPLDQLDEQFRENRRAKIPTVSTPPGVKPVEDLTPGQYTIEQAKQQLDHDMMVKLAEQRKQKKRLEIAALRAQFTRLVAMNNSELPPQHRLTPDEFIMDQSLFEEFQTHKQKKLEGLYKEMAWEMEKAELGYKKLYDYYRKHVHTDLFCVRALASEHVIHSYRLEVQERKRSFTQRRRTVAAIVEPGAMEESVDEMAEEEAELVRLLGRPIDLKDEELAGASDRTMYLLKKVHEKRLKRARRKIAWRKFLATKPADDVDDPDDVEAIEKSRATLGNRPLKADDSYVVPDSYRLTMADGAQRLHACQVHLQQIQSEFNERLLTLREEKVATLRELGQIVHRLQQIQDHLDVCDYQIIPPIPCMALDEQPGGQFQLTVHTELQLKREAQEMHRHKLLSKLRQDSRESAFTVKSHRKSSVAIAKENVSRRQSLRREDSRRDSPTTDEVSTGPASKISTPEDNEQDLSPLKAEMLAVQQIELKYEQSVLLKKIEDKTALFDIQHRQLRHEKLWLDVSVKVGRLRVNTLQHEQLILRECEHLEEGIQQRIDACLDQKAQMDKSLKLMTSQATRQAKELEEYGKKEKVLFSELESLIGETNPFHDYLVKVFKKKVKRKNLARRDVSGQSSSGSESESSEDDEESDEDDDDALHLDLNTCPAKCSQQIYDSVIALREQRLDLDEQTMEVKKARETVVKETEGMTKKRLGIDQTLNKAEKDLMAFQLEKQKRVNALHVLCTIQLHQIQCLRRNGEFRSITDELILSEEELIRLQNRIVELKQEKQEERKKTVQRRRLHAHLQHERNHFLDRLAAADKVCNKEMVKKLGRLVDLEVVETVVADPQVEDVRSRLIRSQRATDQQMRASCRDLRDLKAANIDSLRLDTDYKLLEASLKSEVTSLEKALDGALVSGVHRFEDETHTLPNDVQRLMDVVAAQRKVMQSLIAEIRSLQGGTSAQE